MMRYFTVFYAGWQKISGLWQDGEKGIQKKMKQFLLSQHIFENDS